MAQSKLPIILLAFANDAEAPLRELALEQDDLREALREVNFGGRVQVITMAAATPEKIITFFQQHRGQICIFHYGGHSDQEALFLRKDFPGQDNTKAIYLAEFLGLQESLELVFINGCLSIRQAELFYREGAKAIIATDNTIEDLDAREFARYFYQALAGGATISEAFRSAETGYKSKYGGPPRGAGSKKNDKGPNWKLFPESPHHWRIPLSAAFEERKKPHFVTALRPPRQDKLLQRLSVLESMRVALAEKPVLWLHGPSGCGKTVLAEQFYHRFLHNYQNVAWIEVKQDFLQDFIAAAPGGVPISEVRARLREQDRTRPEIDQECARVFSQFLANVPGSLLLIIDGLKTLADFEPFYDLLQFERTHVLFTSYHIPARDSKLNHRYRYGTLASPPLTDEEIKLLAIQYKQDYPWTPEVMERLRHNVLLSSILFKNIPRSRPEQVDAQLRDLLRQVNSEEIDQSLLTQLFNLFLSGPVARWLLLQWAALPEGFYDRALVARIIGLETEEQKIKTQAFQTFKRQKNYRRIKNPAIRFNEVTDQLLENGWLISNEDGNIGLHSMLVEVLRTELSPRLDYFIELAEYIDEAFFLPDEVGYEEPEEKADERLVMHNNIKYENHLRSLLDLVQEEASEDYLSLLYKWISILEASFKLPEELRMWKRYVQLAFSCKAFDLSRQAFAVDGLGNCYQRNGKFQEALNQFQKALTIRKAVLHETHPSLAISYSNIGIIYRNLEKYDEALYCHQKAVAIREAVLYEKHPDLASSFNNLAVLYLDLGQYENALIYNQKSLAIFESILDANHPELADFYSNIAQTHYQLGQWEKALDFNLKALAIRHTVLSPQHPDLAMSYNNIGLIYHALGRYEAALSSQQNAIAISELVLGTDHPLLSTSYSNIAEIYNTLGQYEKALTYQQKALAIIQKAPNSNSPRLAALCNNIGLTYQAIGQHDVALGYLQKALTIQEVVLDDQHPDLAAPHNNIAMVYHALGKYQKALVHHQKALDILETALGPNHPQMAKLYSNIALNYKDLGQYEKILDYLQKAVAIHEAVLDAEHPDLGASYNNIAVAYRHLGQHELAICYNQKALTVLEKVLGTNHPNLVKVYHNAAASYRELRQLEKALSYNQKALTIAEAVLDPKHPDLATCYHNMAGNYRGLGQYDLALSFHHKALTIHETVLDAHHPDLAKSYHNAAKTYHSLGQYEEALRYYEKAISIQQMVLSPAHPDIAKSYRNIALTLIKLGQEEQADEYEAKATAIRENRNK